ncbi:hypothetical protein EE612_056511 [Oryza sativa]|nr:hypothetical protein EE612_056511 [Oryza sativa]
MSKKIKSEMISCTDKATKTFFASITCMESSLVGRG